MRVIDTFDSIIDLRNRTIQAPERYFELWKRYAAYCIPELLKMLETDSAAYDRERDIKPVAIKALTAEFAQLKEAHDHLIALYPAVQERYLSLFPASRGATIYFYIGLCNGAGWATAVDGNNAVLLGAEKIVELKWHGREMMDALLCHELCHIAHSDLRQSPINVSYPDPAQRAVWQLYIEGFAQRYEQVLLAQDHFYHQDKDGWLDWCDRNKHLLAGEYLRRIVHQESVQDFFGDWKRFMGHADTGYYLGCQFIASLEQSYPTGEIAVLTFGEVDRLLRSFLEECSTSAT